MPAILDKPFIFLDIDGVLNGNTYVVANRCGLYTSDDTEWFDPVNVALLNRITEATGAVLVLSTSWVNMFRRPYFEDLLPKVGIKAPIFEVTDRYAPGRVERIDQWLDAWAPTVPWIVLDDCITVAKYAPRAIITDTRTGLTELDAQKAITLLQEAPTCTVKFTNSRLGEMRFSDGKATRCPPNSEIVNS